MKQETRNKEKEKMKRFSTFVLLPILAVLGPLFLMLAGCSSSSSGTGSTSTTVSTAPNPLIVSAINNGTSLAVSFGLPLAATATSQSVVTADAQLALTSINGLLAILSPSTTTPASTAALQALLSQVISGDLSSQFSGSPIVQSIIELGLPLLVKNIPSGLTAASIQATANIPPVVLAYTVAFFQGAQTGLQNYLGIAGSSKAIVAPLSSAIVAGNATLDISDFKTKLQAKLDAIKATAAPAATTAPVPNATKAIKK